MKNPFIFAAGAAVICSAAASAEISVGDHLFLTVSDNQPSYMSDYYYNSGGSYTDPTWTGLRSGIARAGLITWSNRDGGSIGTFCVEIHEQYPSTEVDYTVVETNQVPEEDPPGVMNADQITVMEDLFFRYQADAYENTSNSQATWAVNAAAFQLLIWEIAFEDRSGATSAADIASRLDLTDGAFQITSIATDVMTQANVMIAALQTNNFSQFTGLLGLTNPDSQDLLIVVPSPAIAGLAGLGLVGMRRRRR